ncbi:unnamed protein product [Rhizoctonia solani]|uniref:Ricin B lectin domain-containing protein n=1 Tax=Rhizoctonia solani TaxID=456999 RepID=A0A8H2X5W0_9AGAM|nr:unnamed protein product [Rhizoctonia solani]
MVELKDGCVYRVVNMSNHLLVAYAINQEIPGCWLTAQPYANGHYESRFKATSCPGDKWKFVVVDKPNLCVGFQGWVSGGLQILEDGGEGCHTEWAVDRKSGPSLVEIHANTDNGEACWTIPYMGPPGAAVELASSNGSPEQRWKFTMAVDS